MVHDSLFAKLFSIQVHAQWMFYNFKNIDGTYEISLHEYQYDSEQ